MFIGGDFRVAGPAFSRGVVMRRNGLFESVDGGLDGRVSAMAIWNGQLVAGGQFSASLHTNGLANIARWDGTTWQPVGNEIGRAHV